MGDSIRSSGELTPQNLPAMGARVVFDVPRTADLETMMIALTGTVTLSTGAAALLTDGILNLIESVELTADNGKTVIVSVPFRMAVQGNFARRKKGAVPSITQPGLGIATHAFEAEALLDMGYGLMRAKDAFLRENAYTDLKLALRFAPDWTGVFTGGGFVVSGQTLAVTVAVRECLELPDASGNASHPLVRVQRTANDIVIAGAANKQQFKLTPEQGLRAIALRVTSAGSLSDAALSRIRIYQGKVMRFELSGTALKEFSRAEYVGGQLTGYYFIDFADGNGAPDKLTDLLDLSKVETGGADSFIEFDTGAAATITVDQHGYVTL